MWINICYITGGLCQWVAFGALDIGVGVHTSQLKDNKIHKVHFRDME